MQRLNRSYIGETISTATLQIEDLMQAFREFLEREPEGRIILREYDKLLDEDGNLPEETEEACWLLDDAFDYLGDCPSMQLHSARLRF